MSWSPSSVGFSQPIPTSAPPDAPILSPVGQGSRGPPLSPAAQAGVRATQPAGDPTPPLLFLNSTCPNSGLLGEAARSRLALARALGAGSRAPRPAVACFKGDVIFRAGAVNSRHGRLRSARLEDIRPLLVGREHPEETGPRGTLGRVTRPDPHLLPAPLSS